MSSDEIINIYKNNLFLKYKKKQKVVVFDFDETIGSFIDLERLWSGIVEWKQKYRHSMTIGRNSQQTIYSQDENSILFPQFDHLLDLYPEFLRY